MGRRPSSKSRLATSLARKKRPRSQRHPKRQRSQQQRRLNPQRRQPRSQQPKSQQPKSQPPKSQQQRSQQQRNPQQRRQHQRRSKFFAPTFHRNVFTFCEIPQPIGSFQGHKIHYREIVPIFAEK